MSESAVLRYTSKVWIHEGGLLKREQLLRMKVMSMLIPMAEFRGMASLESQLSGELLTSQT